MYLCMYVFVRGSVCVYEGAQYTCICVLVYVYMCETMYMYMCVHMYVGICTKCIPTHTTTMRLTCN